MANLILSIVTWNSEDSISACLSSVLAQTNKDFEVMVVDNNSHDRTCEIVESFNHPRVSLVRKKENTGFCGGHNHSIQNSNSEFILLVNPDVIMDSRYVENAMRAMSSNPKIGTVCGLLLQSDISNPESIIDSAGLEKRRSGIMQLRHHGKKYKEMALTNGEVFGADGALPLYRRSMIEDISYAGQFFDELFFAHKEDWDVSWRAQIYGWKTLFEPSCVAVHPRHFKPKSLAVRKHVSGAIKVHSVKNQLILLLKNESLSSFLLNFIFIVPRQVMIFLYILLFETSSLKAYRIVIKDLKGIMARRTVIQHRRKKTS